MCIQLSIYKLIEHHGATITVEENIRSKIITVVRKIFEWISPRSPFPPLQCVQIVVCEVQWDLGYDFDYGLLLHRFDSVGQQSDDQDPDDIWLLSNRDFAR